MFKWVFIVQVIVYLLLIPLINESYIVGYNAPAFYGILAITALLCGFASCRARPSAHATLVPRRWLLPVLIVSGVLYCYFSYSFGLLNRRLGSEYMADTFGNLPFLVLLIIRGFEIVFIPTIVIFIKSRYGMTAIEKLLLILTIAATIPFMGLADSRGRLLVLGLSILIFLDPAQVRSALRRSKLFYVAAGGAIGMFVFVTMQRAQYYARSTDYYLADVIARLDGMNIVRDLVDFRHMSFWGTYDWNMFSFLIAKIPFSEQARLLKMMGTTSTKQYYLKDVLGRNVIDASNSMITDPLYFGGAPMLFAAFLILGYCISYFDRVVASGALLTGAWKSTLIFSFGLSFVIFEADFVGALTNMATTFIVCFVLLRFCCRTVDASQSSPSAKLQPKAVGRAAA